MTGFADSYLNSPDTRFLTFAVLHIVFAFAAINLSSSGWRLRRLPFAVAAIFLIGLSYGVAACINGYLYLSADDAVITAAAMFTMIAAKGALTGLLVAARCRDFSDKWKLHASAISVLCVAHGLAIFIAAFKSSKVSEDYEEQFA